MSNKLTTLFFCTALFAAVSIQNAYGEKQAAGSPEPASNPWLFDGLIGLNATGTGLVNWTGSLASSTSTGT